MNPIYKAIDDGNAQALQVELLSGVSHTDPSQRCTALQKAALLGKMECVRVLLNAQDPVDQTCPQDKDSPLILASRNGHLDVVDLLIQSHANVNFVGNYGETALFRITILPPTPLTSKIARLLLQNQAQISARNLECAVTYERNDLLPLFLDHGADLNHTTVHGESLYTLALKAKNRVALRILEERGANRYLGRALPLHAALDKDITDLAKLLQNASIDVDQKDLDETTPLLAAVVARKVNAAKLLLKAKANPNSADQRQLTPLLAAIAQGEDDLAREIIIAGAEINHRNVAEGWNAVWVSALKGRVALFEDLLNCGGDFQTLDKYNCSLLAMIKTHRPPHKKRLIEILNKYAGDSFKQMQVYAKAFIQNKRFAHAQHLKGVVSIQGIEVNLEFGQLEDAVNTLAKSWRMFTREFDLGDEQSAKELFYALQFAADQRSHHPQQILHRIKRGIPTIILTGWREHAVTVLIYENFFLCCNTGPSGKFSQMTASFLGDAHIAPLEVYRYDPKCLDVDCIKLLTDGCDPIMGDREAYAYAMYTKLPEKLSLQQFPEDQWIVAKANMQRQSVNNCSRTAAVGIMNAYLTLKDLSEIFEKFVTFEQSYLSRYSLADPKAKEEKSAENNAYSTISK